MPQSPDLSPALQSFARSLPDSVFKLCRTLAEAGHRAWVVGGAVRDALLAGGASESHQGDIDLCTDASPQQVQKLFRKVIPTGIEHGTVTVLLQGQAYELTTLRGEKGFSDGRHPDQVFFVQDLAEDLARRDFTVNAMAFDPLKGSLHDPYGGREDLKNRLLRAVGSPPERFREDGLRVLRCLRFAVKLQFEVEEETRAAIAPSLDSYRKVSLERVRDELYKGLSSRQPARFVQLLAREGLLEISLPELMGETSVQLLDEAPAQPLLRLGLLMALRLPGGTVEQARQAEELAQRLRLSREERERLSLWLRCQETPAADSGLELHLWMSRVGHKELPGLLSWRRARLGLNQADALEDAVEAALAKGVPLSVGELAISGKSLLGTGEFKPGPGLGRLLSELLLWVQAEPTRNQAELLLRQARELQLSQLGSAEPPAKDSAHK